MSLKPPYNFETATKKVKTAEDLWNTCDPIKVAAAYTPDCAWRNRDEFFSGTKGIEAFLTRKWQKEHNYRLRKELFCFHDDRIAVEFWYEHSSVLDVKDPNVKWYRTYGIEHWVFDRDTGKMKSRQMSGNTIEIQVSGRWFKDGVDVNSIEVPHGHISSK